MSKSTISEAGVRLERSYHTLTAQDPLPPDLCDALALIKQPKRGAH